MAGTLKAKAEKGKKKLVKKWRNSTGKDEDYGTEWSWVWLWVSPRRALKPMRMSGGINIAKKKTLVYGTNLAIPYVNG